MTILSITVSVEDNKLFYIKKSVEEGKSKFSCHHFTFDSENQAEITLDENGAIKSIAPCKHVKTTEQNSLSSSQSAKVSTVSNELKFIKNSTTSIVIIDSESFLQREIKSESPKLDLEEKVILSIEKLDNDLEGLKLHVERLVAEGELA